MTTKVFSQFRACHKDKTGRMVNGDHKGRTATLKAVAYCTGADLVDERNNRHFDYSPQGMSCTRFSWTALCPR